MTTHDKVTTIVQFSHGLEDFVRDIARETAERRVNELRSGVVENSKHDCCPDLWPWFCRTFLDGARLPEEQSDIFVKRIAYRNRSVNFCPFCGAKL